MPQVCILLDISHWKMISMFVLQKKKYDISVFALMTVMIIFTISFAFQPNSAYAQIEWNQITDYGGDTLGRLVIYDSSMNANQSNKDTFDVKVWSDSDPVGIILPVSETDDNNGEFRPDNLKPLLLSAYNESKSPRLHVSENESVWVSYDGKDPFLLIEHVQLTSTAGDGNVKKLPPLKQLKWFEHYDDFIENVSCNSDFHLIQNISSEKIACVTFSTMEKLTQRGIWKNIFPYLKNFETLYTSISTHQSSYLIGSDIIVTIVDPNRNNDNDRAETFSLDFLEWTVISNSEELQSLYVGQADDSIFLPEPSDFRAIGDDSDTFQIVIRVPEKIGDTLLEEGQQVRLTYDVDLPGIHTDPSTIFILE